MQQFLFGNYTLLLVTRYKEMETLYEENAGYAS
jgi:hypothetical protein